MTTNSTISTTEPTILLAELCNRHGVTADVLAALTGNDTDAMEAALAGDTSRIPTADLEEIARGLGYDGNPFDLLEPREKPTQSREARENLRTTKRQKLGGRTNQTPREREEETRHLNKTTLEARTVGVCGAFVITRGIIDHGEYYVEYRRAAMYDKRYMGRFNSDADALAAAPTWIRSHHIADDLPVGGEPLDLSMKDAEAKAKAEDEPKAEEKPATTMDLIREAEARTANYQATGVKAITEDATGKPFDPAAIAANLSAQKPACVTACHMFDDIISSSKMKDTDVLGLQTIASRIAIDLSELYLNDRTLWWNHNEEELTRAIEAMGRTIELARLVDNRRHGDATRLLEVLHRTLDYMLAAPPQPWGELRMMERMFACYPAIAQRTYELYQSTIPYIDTDPELHRRAYRLTEYVCRLPHIVFDEPEKIER